MWLLQILSKSQNCENYIFFFLPLVLQDFSCYFPPICFIFSLMFRNFMKLSRQYYLQHEKFLSLVTKFSMSYIVLKMEMEFNNTTIFSRTVWWRAWSFLTPSATTNGLQIRLLSSSSTRKICLQRKSPSHHWPSASLNTQVNLHSTINSDFLVRNKIRILWRHQWPLQFCRQLEQLWN